MQFDARHAALPRTIVFIDIYDFGRVVAGLNPVDLVLMLDRVFTQMDLVCQDSRDLRGGDGWQFACHWSNFRSCST